MDTRIALISGGLGDIGLAIAAELGQQGIKIAIGDVMEETSAQSHLSQLHRNGCSAVIYHKVDVTDEVAVKEWVAMVEKIWGVPQIVIPNAGIVVRGRMTDDDLDTSEVRRQMEVNFWGCYHLAVLAAKRMKREKLPGRIVFIGSWVADRPLSRISAYCISKAAVRMLCKALAMELAGDQILVNEVAPGIVEGGLSKQNQQQDPQLRNRQLQATPVHSLISASEIARHVAYLSNFSSMTLTGSTIVVDGGLSLTSKMTP